MKCRISQDTYDALKAATLAGDIDSFSFQYVHKGVEFSLKARNNNLSHQEWKDLLLEIYFDNELPEYTGFYPEIEDNELVLDISCSVNLNYDGESSDLWENGELLLLLQKVLLPIIGAEIGQEDIMLDLSMSATEDDMGTLESYSLYNWANDKCYMGSGPTYCFFIEINESRVGEFYEDFSERVELIIV
jgi:hypothetical protein